LSDGRRSAPVLPIIYDWLLHALLNIKVPHVVDRYIDTLQANGSAIPVLDRDTP
jgi:hypothetical protein